VTALSNRSLPRSSESFALQHSRSVGELGNRFGFSQCAFEIFARHVKDSGGFGEYITDMECPTLSFAIFLRIMLSALCNSVTGRGKWYMKIQFTTRRELYIRYSSIYLVIQASGTISCVLL
jgi:hypothetical protein